MCLFTLSNIVNHSPLTLRERYWKFMIFRDSFSNFVRKLIEYYYVLRFEFIVSYHPLHVTLCTLPFRARTWRINGKLFDHFLVRLKSIHLKNIWHRINRKKHTDIYSTCVKNYSYLSGIFLAITFLTVIIWAHHSLRIVRRWLKMIQQSWEHVLA